MATVKTILRDPSGLLEQREVGLDLSRCSRPLNLDGDRPAVRERCPMHLADRRRGDRRRLEVEERALEREPELALDNLLDLLERERSHIVLERA